MILLCVISIYHRHTLISTGLSSNKVLRLATTCIYTKLVRPCCNRQKNPYLRLVSFSSLLAVLVILRLISAAIKENSLRGWCCFCFPLEVIRGDESSERLSRVDDAFERDRIRSTMEWNSLVRSLKDMAGGGGLKREEEKEKENSTHPFSAWNTHWPYLELPLMRESTRIKGV